MVNGCMLNILYYNDLPNYFMEFDIYDKLENKFLLMLGEKC